MRLADELTCTIGGEVIVLRPSLRNAIRLERRSGSFAGVAAKIMEGSLETACAIMRDNAAILFLEHRVLDALPSLQEPLIAYVAACAGIDASTDHRTITENKASEAVPFRAYLESLYRIGTGWLGWPPSVTLDATPAEITEAYKGRVDFLRAVFGASEPDTPKPGDLGDKFKAVFSGLNTTKIKRPIRKARKAA